MKVKIDAYDYPPWHQFTVVRCDKCGVFYEPSGKEHTCKKKDIAEYEKEKLRGRKGEGNENRRSRKV